MYGSGVMWLKKVNKVTTLEFFYYFCRRRIEDILSLLDYVCNFYVQPY